MLMQQDHREFEVVVVNDRSEDDTWELLQLMKPVHPRLRPVNIQADEEIQLRKEIGVGCCGLVRRSTRTCCLPMRIVCQRARIGSA